MYCYIHLSALFYSSDGSDTHPTQSRVLEIGWDAPVVGQGRTSGGVQKPLFIRPGGTLPLPTGSPHTTVTVGNRQHRSSNPPEDPLYGVTSSYQYEPTY